MVLNCSIQAQTEPPGATMHPNRVKRQGSRGKGQRDCLKCIFSSSGSIKRFNGWEADKNHAHHHKKNR